MSSSNVSTQAEALLAAARGGNQSALGALFSLYQNYIKLLAATQVRSRLRTRASESDIVQEYFIRATNSTGGPIATNLHVRQLGVDDGELIYDDSKPQDNVPIDLRDGWRYFARISTATTEPLDYLFGTVWITNRDR